MMRTLMVLAPHLAKLTYAAPHAIMPGMLGYTMTAVNLPAAPLPTDRALRSAVHMMAPPEPSPSQRNPQPRMQYSAEVGALQEQEVGLTAREANKVTALPAAGNGFLIHKDNTWRAVSAMTPELLDGELSDARLTTRTFPGGTKEWTIDSPIQFNYRVRECEDVLDPRSDVLIYGHLADAESLMRAKLRPLKRVVVVDDKVHALYGERIEAYFAHHNVTTKLMVLPTTEENKDIEMALKIAEQIHELGIDRRLDPVIAIGGGVCMDIVGFAASIYRRRTPYVRVPTTLMGYVDASVGAKTGVNFCDKKNKLGCYVPPALAILDRQFLATLDARQISNGAAEIMKMALVKDAELFDLLERHGPALVAHKFQALPDGVGDAPPSRVLDLSIHTMLEELAPNLWEDSLERLVDFGHVFSMELEMAQLHADKLYHGEAVAIDMAFCTVLAYVRGQIDAQLRDRILRATKGLGLPIYHPAFDEAMCDEAMYERVKFSSGQKMPLPTGVGESRLFNDISMDECRAALALWPTLVEV